MESTKSEESLPSH